MEKLRLIQCGVGGWGAHWRQGPVRQSDDFQLVSIVDVNPAALDEAGNELRIPRDRRFSSLEIAIQSVQADAVLTVTPPPVHLEHAEIAFANGLHLLTEKPISHDLFSARRMVELARDADRHLVVAQNYRYSPVMRRLKSLVREQCIGDVGHGHIDFYIPADFTGSFRQKMEYPLLVDMSIHHIDLIRAISGREIVSVTARTFNPAWSWYDHHAGLKMLVELEGGVLFSYSGDWSALGRCTSWNGDWRIQCARGAIHLSDEAISISRCERWGKNSIEDSIDIPPLPRSGQAALLHDFAEAIRTGAPAETAGEDNLKSFAAVMAAMTSAREGRSVPLPEMLK